MFKKRRDGVELLFSFFHFFVISLGNLWFRLFFFSFFVECLFFPCPRFRFFDAFLISASKVCFFVKGFKDYLFISPPKVYWFVCQRFRGLFISPPKVCSFVCQRFGGFFIYFSAKSSFVSQRFRLDTDADYVLH